MNLIFKVNAKIDVVFDYLTDMQKFVAIHPVITKINSLGNNNYLVHETLKIGFIPISFTYPVNIVQNKIAKNVIIKATVMKVNKIEMIFNLHTKNQSTIIEEFITFKTFFAIKPIMQSIFKKQHLQLFKNLDLAEDQIH